MPGLLLHYSFEDNSDNRTGLNINILIIPVLAKQNIIVIMGKIRCKLSKLHSPAVCVIFFVAMVFPPKVNKQVGISKVFNRFFIG